LFLSQGFQDQNGYGFVHFPLTEVGIESACIAIQLINNQTIGGVTYACNISHDLAELFESSARFKLPTSLRTNSLPLSSSSASISLPGSYSSSLATTSSSSWDNTSPPSAANRMGGLPSLHGIPMIPPPINTLPSPMHQPFRSPSNNGGGNGGAGGGNNNGFMNGFASGSFDMPPYPPMSMFSLSYPPTPQNAFNPVNMSGMNGMSAGVGNGRLPPPPLMIPTHLPPPPFSYQPLPSPQGYPLTSPFATPLHYTTKAGGMFSFLAPSSDEYHLPPSKLNIDQITEDPAGEEEAAKSDQNSLSNSNGGMTNDPTMTSLSNEVRSLRMAQV
jgi:hypothetical protein